MAVDPPSDEISFLASSGAPMDALIDARRLARKTGVSPLVALLAGGRVSDNEYYAALARRLGVPFLSTAPEFHRSAEPGAALNAAVLRTDGGERFVIAPEGADLRRLLSLRRVGARAFDRLAITTPRRLVSWKRALEERATARAACEDLARFDSTLSAKSLAGDCSRAVLTGAALGFPVAMMMGGLFWIACSLIFFVLAAAAIGARLYALAASIDDQTREPSPIPNSLLPTYTIVVPLYREAAVAKALVAALNALDYPRLKLQAILVVEAEDVETRLALELLDPPAWCEILTAPPGAPRTKPRALNIALAAARGQLLAVYDAEDAPEPDQLRRAAARFAAGDARLACVQARLAIDNTSDGWLAKLFALEYAGLFDALDHGIACIGAPMLLGGTSNHFRVDALRRARGWDAWNVTEDADLGVRLARFGYRVETIESTTHEEAPARLISWLSQRRRWIKGWMQTIIVHGRDLTRVTRELGVRRAAMVIALLFSGVFGSLFGPLFILRLVDDGIRGELLTPPDLGSLIMNACWIWLALVGLGAHFWQLAIGVHRRRLHDIACWLFALPAYYCLLSLAAWLALVDLWRDPHGWSKTRHGLARSSRRAGTTDARASAPV